MAATISVAIGQIIDNKYRVDRILAQGGMGLLVAATHVHLDERVVVKFRLAAGQQTDRKRFTREAQLAIRLRGEHICRVMDLGFLGENAPYIVMELLDGRDLADEVSKRGPLPISDAVEYILQTCEAMTEAHALGIVHRDLKPENLFLTHRHDGTPLVKVLDFGISKQLGMPITNDQDLMGTPGYMAPEQWSSPSSIDAKADIYAIGATLHFLLSGVPPVRATSLPELFEKVMTQPPPPLRSLRAEVPRDLEMLVLKCLEVAANDRPNDVIAVAGALLPFAPARARAARSLLGRAGNRWTNDPERQVGQQREGVVPFATASTVASDRFANAKRGRPWGTIAILTVAVAGTVLLAATQGSKSGDAPTTMDSSSVTTPRYSPPAHRSVVDAGEVLSVPSIPSTPGDGSAAAPPVRSPTAPPTRRQMAVLPQLDAGVHAQPVEATTSTTTPVPSAEPAKVNCKSDDALCQFGRGKP